MIEYSEYNNKYFSEKDAHYIRAGKDETIDELVATLQKLMK